MGRHRQLDYVIRRQGSHWTIDFSGWTTGRFETPEAAVSAAQIEADRVRRQWGHDVRIIRQDDGSQPARARLRAQLKEMIRLRT